MVYMNEKRTVIHCMYCLCVKIFLEKKKPLDDHSYKNQKDEVYLSFYVWSIDDKV